MRPASREALEKLDQASASHVYCFATHSDQWGGDEEAVGRAYREHLISAVRPDQRKVGGVVLVELVARVPFEEFVDAPQDQIGLLADSPFAAIRALQDSL